MPDKYSSEDNYKYSNNNVLKNKLGIYDQGKLDLAEAEFVSLRSLECSKNFFKLPFDHSILARIHRHLFQDIYDWAGIYRTVDISKGTTRFCNVNFIENSIKSIMNTLHEEHFLQNLEKKEFSMRSAYYMGEINAIHPFREGNGRTQREFLNQLALNKGFYIYWHKCDVEEILDATNKSYNQEYSSLEKIIFENLHDI